MTDSIRPSPQLPETAWKALQSFFAADTKMKDTQAAEAKAFRAKLEQMQAAHITTLGNVPLIVLSPGRADLYSDPTLPAEVTQQAEQAWQQMQADLVRLSPKGKQVIATASGHYIQLDQPQPVIDAIQLVVTAARQ